MLFLSNVGQCFQKNNKSAVEEFVSEAITDLVHLGTVDDPAVNPLTVSVQAIGKKRLILDLR